MHAESFEPDRPEKRDLSRQDLDSLRGGELVISGRLELLPNRLKERLGLQDMDNGKVGRW